MWFCMILGTIIMIISIFIYLDEGYIFSVLMGIIGGVAGYLIGILISLIITAIVCCYAETTIDSEITTPLITLQDNYNIEGYRYLYRGYIDKELKYTYLYKDERGITSEQIPANKTYINYIKEGETPTLIKHNYKFKNPIVRFFTIDCVDPDYSVYIPSGSIIAEGQYEIDLK